MHGGLLFSFRFGSGLGCGLGFSFTSQGGEAVQLAGTFLAGERLGLLAIGHLLFVHLGQTLHLLPQLLRLGGFVGGNGSRDGPACHRAHILLLGQSQCHCIASLAAGLNRPQRLNQVVILARLATAELSLRKSGSAAEVGQRHSRQHGQHDGHPAEAEESFDPTASTCHDRTVCEHDAEDEKHGAAIIVEIDVGMGFEEPPRVREFIRRPARHGHCAAEAGDALGGGDEELPFGVGVRHIGGRRGERDGLRQPAVERRELLLIHQVHGERLVAVRAARQRDNEPLAVALGLARLVVHVAAPEGRARRELEALMLPVVVLHHEAGLREHLARLGHDAGDLRAVGHGIQHALLVEARRVRRESEVPAGVAPRQQHGPGAERAVGLGQLARVNGPQRLGGGLGLEFQVRRRRDRERTGLALDAVAMRAREVERGFLRVELVVVGDDERVTAPGFVLEGDGPHVRRLLLPPDVRPGELDVLPVRRQPHFELLHALIQDAEADGRAAAHEAVTDGDEVEHLGHDARGQALGGEGEFPIGGISSEGQRFITGSLTELRYRNLPRVGQRIGLEPDARCRGRADEGGFLRRARESHGGHGDLRGEGFVRLLQREVEAVRPKHALGEVDSEFARRGLPILHVRAAHVGHVEVGRVAELGGVDAGLEHAEVDRVAHDEARLLQPGGEARGGFQHRLDAPQPGGDAEGSGVEAPREERAGAGVDLPEAGRGLDLDQRVVRADGECAGLALDVQRLRHGERGLRGRGLDGLLGVEGEGVGFFHRLGELNGQHGPAGGQAGGGLPGVPVTDAVALHAGERVAWRQADGEARHAGLEQLVTELRGELDDRGRDLRDGGGVHGDEGLAGNLRGLALPAQRHDAVRTDDAREGGSRLRRRALDERAAEEFDFNAGVALGLEAGSRGGRAGEGNVVPRLGLGDARDDCELERVDAGLGAVEAIGPRARAGGL